MEAGEGVHGGHGGRGGEVGQGVGVSWPLQRLGFPPRPVFVLGMIVHVLGPDSLGLVDEGSFLDVGQYFPLGTESF